MKLLKDHLDSINKYDVLVFTRLVRGDALRLASTFCGRRLHGGERISYVLDANRVLYVYRIQIVTDNFFELPWMQVKARCKELGVQHVPELHRQRHYCGDGEMLLQLIEPMTEDGMVLRVESGLETRFFKHLRDENAPKVAPTAHSQMMNPCIGTSWGMV